MESILAKIVDDKRQWVAEKKQQSPLEAFLPSVTKSERSFYDALSGSQTKFILECKKASPSKGLIRAEFDLPYIAGVYGQYADVISVLTDEKYFQGSFSFLPQVRDIVPCPVLCKDFIVDPYQVYLARHYQADAILLMLSVLDDDEYTVLASLAEELNLGVLTEVSTEEEVVRAVNLDAKVIGINNRNLRDLSIDLNRTEQLARLVPTDRIIISESGIYTHSHVRHLAQYANGFLIGSSIMAEIDIEQAVRRLLFSDIKICGLTRVKDAQAAYSAGANFGGVIFAESSPRRVTIEQAIEIAASTPLRLVGVFQNQDISDIVAAVSSVPLHVVQLHGREDQLYISELKEHLPDGVEIWKAIGVSEHSPVLEEDVDRYLLDTEFKEQYGGTGRVFDWSLVPDDKRECIMLAGGLTPENTKDAVALGCQGLDFNSGVESSKGIKEHTKIAAVFAALKQY